MVQCLHCSNCCFNNCIYRFLCFTIIIKIMSNISKYERIFNLVAAIRCSERELLDLKAKYADVIKSKRRSECVSCLGELLRVLEKRDYLSPSKTEPLAEIARTFREVSIIRLLTNENSNGINNTNNNVVHNIQRQELPVLPRLPEDPKEQVYECIASDIGQKWTDFARALSIPEGYIDTLGRNNGHISERIREILRYHEDRVDRRMWRSSLLDALAKARRNDLRIRVQYIFDISAPC